MVLLDEEIWKKAKPLELTTHWPEFGKKPSNPVELKITYDKKYIYFSGKVTIDPDSMLIASFKRDIFTMGTDYLTIILDTYNDNENALIFSVSPTGSRTDVAVSGDASGRNPVEIGRASCRERV